MTDSPRPYRILAIDDDSVDLELVRRHLGKATSFSCEFVGHTEPSKAVAQLQTGDQFDVVLLDYMLGAETGLDVLHVLREFDPDLPIIFLTGRGDEETLSEMVRADVSDYIPKSAIHVASLERSVGNAVEKGRMRREIAQQRSDLENLVEALQAREQETLSFYHVLSHELKTPLTAIQEFVSITLDGLGGEVTEAQREYLGIAKRNCLHLKTMLDDLIDVTRLETGKLAMVTSDMDVSAWIYGSVQVHRQAMEEKGIELTITAAEGLRPVTGDEDRLAQVMTNLLTNAIKFTPEGGSIHVDASCCEDDPEMVQIYIEDSGCGMSAEHAKRVFERLYQAKEEDFSIKGGLGLGLNICEGLVRSHGGRIWVDSKPQQGSRFTFVLPFAPQAPVVSSPLKLS